MQVLIELDEETLRRLEAVAPGKSRKRSAFIRAAVQKALWELEEEMTRQAYLAAPDVEPVAFDAAAWEPLPFGGFEPPSEHESTGARSAGAVRKTGTRRPRSVGRPSARKR